MKQKLLLLFLGFMLVEAGCRSDTLPIARPTPTEFTAASATALPVSKATISAAAIDQMRTTLETTAEAVGNWLFKTFPAGGIGYGVDDRANLITIMVDPVVLAEMVNYDVQIDKPIPREHWPSSLLEVLATQDPSITVELIPSLVILTDTLQITGTIATPKAEITPTENSVANDTSLQEKASTPVLTDAYVGTQAYTGISVVDAIVQKLLMGDQEAIRQLIQFTEIACTTAQGLGGPPKCAASEAEGTPVAVFSILAQSGYYIRPNEIGNIQLNFTDLYAVYQVTEGANASADGRPTGEYGLIFIERDSIASSSTVFITKGKIVGLLVNLSQTPLEALEQAKGQVIYRAEQK